MIKVRRLKKLPRLDMNPLSDLAFLLVSFFMMTTTFKTESPTTIATPTSRAELKIPDKNICMISIDREGHLFFGVDNKYDRIKMLEVIGDQNQLVFNAEQKEEFSLINSFGLQFTELPQYLNLPKEQRGSVEQNGIPSDSLHNEFRQWLIAARLSNPRLRFAIHADAEVPFPVINRCFENLRDLNITRFNLITDAKKDDPAT